MNLKEFASKLAQSRWGTKRLDVINELRKYTTKEELDKRLHWTTEQLSLWLRVLKLDKAIFK